MVVADDVICITRRCADRTDFLRPEPALNQAIKYLLALGSMRYMLLPTAVVFMSNHYHLQAWDVCGRHPEFTHWFNRQLTAYVNHLRRRRGAVWDSSEQVNVARVVDDEAILDNAAYILANPVAAFAVSHGRLWPGVRSTPQSAERRPETVARPAFFRNEDWPLEVELSYFRPPSQSNLDAEGYTRHLAKRVAQREGGKRALAARRNIRFAGARSVRRRPWTHRATSPEVAPRYNRKPNVIARCAQARESALLRLGLFRAHYRQALRAFRTSGFVPFPPDTWRVRDRFGHAYAPP